jgi:hypothetical protein
MYKHSMAAVGVAVAGASLLAVLPAQATSLGAATAGGYVQLYDYYGYNEQAEFSGLGSTSLGGSSATVDGAPGGVVTAVAAAPTVHETFATGDLKYLAEAGAASDFDIVLRLDYSLVARTGGAGGYASASVSFGGAWNELKAYNGQSFATPAGDYLLYDAQTNSPFYVELDAEAQNGGYAYADPLLTIDPDWAAANPDLAAQVSFGFSDGVQNGKGVPVAAGVPEPAGWATMIAGLGIVGATLRRRAKIAM